MGLLLASLLWAMEIRAPGGCPSATAIERRLTPLLGERGAARLGDVARVVRAADGSLVLSLAEADGQSLGERRFPGQSCDEAAETVAVTLAIWEAQIHPEISLRLDRLAPVPDPTSTPVAPADHAPPPRADTLLRPGADRPPPRSISLGLGAVMDRQAGQWAPGFRAELGLGRQGRPWRFVAALLGTAPHEQDFSTGRARWWRAAAAAGGAYAFADARHVALELGGAGLAGVAVVAGRGFALNTVSRSFDFGAEAWLRAVGKLGPVRLWGGPGLVGWARRQGVEVAGETTSAALPHLALLAAIGVDFVW